MTDIKKNILEKIQKEDIKPTPRWFFSLKEISLWSLIALSIVAAGCIAGIIMLFLSESDWDAYRKLGPRFGTHLIAYLPFAWLLLLIILIFLIAQETRKTRHGYTRQIWLYVLVALGSGVLLGITLNQFGYSQKLDGFFDRHLPAYIDFDEYHHSLWSDPQDGLLAGEIMSTNKTNTVLDLRTFDGDIWTIDISHVLDTSPCTIGGQIRIIGNEVGSSSFIAETIQTWH